VSLRLPVCVLGAVALLASAIDVHAASPEAARAAQEAKGLMAKGKVTEACALFAQSQRLDPKPETLLALARCQEKAGQLAAALSSYGALAAGKPSGYQINAAIARKALERKVPRLVISVGAAQPPDLSVERDGAAVGAADWNRPVPVDPGTHAITARANGKKTWTGTVTVTKDTAMLTVPALEDDAVAVASQGIEIVALKSIGGATWTDGVGLVLPGAPPPAAAGHAPPPVLVMRDDDLSHVSLSLNVGVGMVTDLLTSGESLGVRGDLTVRAEFRRKSSYVAPWFDVVVPGGYFPDEHTGLFGGSAHVGIDVHPARLPWIGFGPFLGYGLVVFKGDLGMEADHGPDVGLLNIHLRTKESRDHEPIFDADIYLLERFSLREHDKATYGGLRLGVGGSVRFRAFAEYRLAADDDPMLLGLTQRLYAGIGIGGVE
jgi:hypothetical protein